MPLMKFVDLQKEYAYFRDPIDQKVQEVLSSGYYLLGTELTNLEKDFASLIGVRNSIGVKNCTDAIMLTLKAVWKPGMPIILPNFGAYPTAVASRNITDKIYYVDVDRTLTIDASKLPAVRNGIVIVVHLFGNNCDMPAITEYCRANNHILIEDCAQSTGSGSGAQGDYSVFSFYPTKPLASMGDGGMICTNQDSEIFKELRFYGQSGADIRRLGINSRMDEFQAAIVNSKLNKFQALNERRREICGRYKRVVRGFDARDGCVFHQFVMLFNNREQVIQELNRSQIPFIIHYKHHVSEVPVLQGCFNEVSYRVNDKCISLPCHPFMSEEEIQKVEEFLHMHRRYEYDER